MPFSVGKKFIEESQAYFAEKKRLKELEEEVARIKKERSAERDRNPPRRPKTRDELLEDVKASQAYKDQGLKGKNEAAEDPYAFAHTHSIPLERDATPQRMNAAQQAAEAAAENERRAAAGRSRPSTTPGKQRPTSTENATPSRTRPKTEQELRSELKVKTAMPRGYLIKYGEIDKANLDKLREMAIEKDIPTERDRTPSRRQKTVEELRSDPAVIREIANAGGARSQAAAHTRFEKDPYAFARTHSIPLERDRTPPHERKMTPAEAEAYALEEKEKREAAGRSTQQSQSSSMQDRINELEKIFKANTSPGQARGTALPGRNAVSPQRARISSASGASNQSPAPATQRTPSSRRASFAPEVSQSRHASRSRSGTPSQNQSYDAMHEFAERARASSAPRSRTPAEIREEDAFIPNYDWENPFSYDNSVRTDAEIAEMERANAASQTARESIGSIEDEHKNIMKLAHKQYAKPHQVWKVNPVAELSPAQKEYRRNLKRDSPYSEEAQEERAATVDALTPYLTDRTPTEIIKPYVENMTQDPGRLYKDLMEPTEKEHLQSVYDEANDNFTKKILPGIRARYHVPGLRQHGQMRSDLNNATQRFGKGVGSAVAEHKGAFRKMGFDVAQRYAALQGQAGNILSGAADNERQNNLQAFGALKEFKKQDKAEKNLFNSQVKVIGTEDRQRDQDRINEQKNRFTEAQEAPARKLGQLADIQNKYQFAQPIQMPQRTPSSAGQVEKELASVGMGAAGTLFNQAMNPQPQTNRGHFKTGGRVKKAFGGIVNPAETAIDNAVVQKTSPIYELRRLLNLPDPVQQYAIGGLVSPITAGAQEAQQYAGHAAMKNKLQRMRKGPPEIGLMGALADATGDGSGKGWFGQSLKAFHAGYSRQDQRRLAQQQRVDSADDLEYKLQGDIETKAHKERDIARQERIAEAQIAKYKLQGEAAKAKNAFAPNYSVDDLINDTSPKNMENNPRAIKTAGYSGSSQKNNIILSQGQHKSADKKLISTANDDFEQAEELADTALQAYEQFGKVQGNQVLGGINSIFGNTAASLSGKLIGNKGDAGEIKKTNTVSHKLIGKLQAAEKSPGRLKIVAESMMEAKPNYDLPQDFNQSESLGYAKKGANVMRKELQELIDMQANPKVIREKVERIKNIESRIKNIEEMKLINKSGAKPAGAIEPPNKIISQLEEALALSS